MEHFRLYLLHQQFELITDHAALQWLFNKPDPPRKFMRWIIRIMEFPYQIRYKKENYIQTLTHCHDFSYNNR